MAEHNTLTGASLHEPKGAASAGAGEAYLADGLGSGGFAALPPGSQPANVVVVDSASNLPTAVAGVRTLAANTQYTFGPNVDIGSDRIVLNTNSIISGVNRALSGIKSTTTGSLISATGVDCRINDITFDASSAAKLIDFDGSGTGSLRLSDCRSQTHTGIAIDSTDALALVMELCLFIGGTDGILAFGTNNANLVVATSAFIGFSGTAIDLGTSTWGGTALTTVSFSGLGGSVSLSGLTASGNIVAGARFSVTACSFNGAGSALSGITVDDIRYFFLNNQGLADSEIEGHMFLSGSALTTTLAAATPTKINATTWVTNKDKRFTIDANGKLTYIGENDVEVSVSLSVTGSGVSGSNEYNIYIAKNGTEDVSTKGRGTFPSTSDTSVAAFGAISMSTNDFLEPFVEQAGGTNFNAKDANMIVRV